MTNVLDKPKYAPIDSSAVVEFHQSTGKSLLMAVGAIIGAVVALFFAVGLIADGDGGSFDAFFCLAAFVVFGLAGLVGLWRTVAVKGPVLVFSPEGLFDNRISSAVIQWKIIDEIEESSLKVSGLSEPAKAMVLKIKPELEAIIPLTRIAKMTRSANAKLGADGLTVMAGAPLDIKHDRLMKIALAYWKAHGPGSAGQNLKNA